MTCLGFFCQESKYTPTINKKKTVYVGPAAQKAACEKKAERDAAIDLAEAELKRQLTALDETITCQGDCECTGAKVWLAAVVDLQNQKWAKTMTTANGCKLKVTFEYDRKYEETQPRKCHKKPLPTPEPPDDFAR